RTSDRRVRKAPGRIWTYRSPTPGQRLPTRIRFLYGIGKRCSSPSLPHRELRSALPYLAAWPPHRELRSAFFPLLNSLLYARTVLHSTTMNIPPKKIEQLSALMRAGEWERAIKFAARFPRLG